MFINSAAVWTARVAAGRWLPVISPAGLMLLFGRSNVTWSYLKWLEVTQTKLLYFKS